MSIFNILNSGSSEGVFSVFHRGGQVIRLIRRQQLYTFAIWTDHENPWEDEASDIRIALDTDSLNIPLGFIALVVWGWLPVLVFLEFVIRVLLQLIQVVDLVVEWALAVSDSQVDFFSFVANMSIIDTWIISSIWSVMLFQVARITSKTGSFVVIVDGSSGLGRDDSEVTLLVDHEARKVLSLIDVLNDCLGTLRGVLRVLPELDGLDNAAIRKIDQGHKVVEGFEFVALKPFFKVFSWFSGLIHDWGKSLLLNSGLSAVILAEDLGAISVLAIKVAILVFNQDNVVLTDLSNDSSFGIGLLEAVDLGQVFANSIFVLPSESLVIGDGPFQFVSLELGEVAVWPQNLNIEIIEMANNDTALEVDSVDFCVGLLVFEGRISDLNDISIRHMPDDEAVLDS